MCPTCKRRLPEVPGIKFCPFCAYPLTEGAKKKMEGYLRKAARVLLKKLGCPDCGHLNPEGAHFCAQCGHAFVCTKCRTRLEPGAQFCHGCGEKIGSPATKEKPEAGPAEEEKSPQCRNCGEPVLPGQKRCGKCRAFTREFTRLCPYCRMPLADQLANSCQHCGREFPFTLHHIGKVTCQHGCKDQRTGKRWSEELDDHLVKSNIPFPFVTNEGGKRALFESEQAYRVFYKKVCGRELPAGPIDDQPRWPIQGKHFLSVLNLAGCPICGGKVKLDPTARVKDALSNVDWANLASQLGKRAAGAAKGTGTFFGKIQKSYRKAKGEGKKNKK